MKKLCQHCQSEMVAECQINIEGGLYGIKIIKKKAGLFSNISEKVKAAVCPNCGNVAFYVEEYEKFND